MTAPMSLNRIMPRLLLILLLAAPHLCTPAGAAQQVSVEAVEGSDYLPAVHRELGAATQSVVVTMFQMRLHEDTHPASPVLPLVNDLIAAHRRGVQVRVILEVLSKVL